MNYVSNLNILIGLCILQSSGFAQSLDDVFKRADKAQSRTEQSVGGSVHSDMDRATSGLKEKVTAGDERANALAARTRQSEAGAKYSCSVTCTGSWWASGSNVTVLVAGGSEDQAKELAAKEADPYCRKQTSSSGVLKNISLSAGSAKCERK